MSPPRRSDLRPLGRRSMAEIRVGISGWTYPPWRGKFYPPGLTQKLELAYASRRFNALEINGTFYSLQRPSSFQSWHEATPPGFIFAIKGPRFLTHFLKLKSPRQALANFLASGVLCLREKLGPILWQFPPQMPFNEDRFKEFFDLLPRDTAEMSRLGKEHNAFVKNRDIPRFRREQTRAPCGRIPPRKFPERSLHRTLGEAQHRVSRCRRGEQVSNRGRHHRGLDLRPLARFAPALCKRLYASRNQSLGGEAARMEPRRRTVGARRIGCKSKAAKNGRDVYVFFDNTDVKLRAPVDARRMAEQLGICSSQTPNQLLRELGINRRSKTRVGAEKKS